MIPVPYHRLAVQIHEERIAHALETRPEWPSPTVSRAAWRACGPWRRPAGWPTLLAAAWPGLSRRVARDRPA
jgi:hypothetical protein